MKGKEELEGIVPALSGARGNGGSHVRRKSHKSGGEKKKEVMLALVMPMIEPLWRRAFASGHLLALALPTLSAKSSAGGRPLSRRWNQNRSF